MNTVLGAAPRHHDLGAALRHHDLGAALRHHDLGAALRRYVLGGASRRYVVVAMGMGIVAALSSCDPCAGTVRCSNYPEISYSGQFVEHKTGKLVPGVQVMFVRDGGVPMPVDTLRGQADAHGFFKLTAPVFGVGEVVGRLFVTPPAPFPPYVVPGVSLMSSTSGGDGRYDGRIAVDPYFIFAVEVYDRRFAHLVPNARVRLKRVGGPLVTPDSFELTMDPTGHSFTELRAFGLGEVIFEATVNLPEVVDDYVFNVGVRPEFIERPPYFTQLRVPRVINYVVEFSRRGTGEFLPGTTVYVNQLSGVKFKPFEFTVALESNGRGLIAPEALGDGDTFVEMIVTPPPPLLPETLTNVRMTTQYSDELRLLGVFNYGPGMFFRSKLIDRGTGLPLKAGTQGVVARTGGLPLVYAGGALTTADSGIRDTDADGWLSFAAATMDTGNVQFQTTVRPRGFTPEVIQNLVVKARRNGTVTDLGPFTVGGWFPWYGVVREQGGGPVIPGAHVTFVRSSGVSVVKDTLVTVSDALGVFRLNPVPLGAGSLTGTVRISFDSVYRDTVITPVTITTTQNDTLKLLATYPIARRP